MISGIDARTDGYPNAAPKAQGAGKSPASLVLVCVAVHSLRLSLGRCRYRSASGSSWRLPAVADHVLRG